MCPSARPRQGEGKGSYWHENLPWTGGDVCAKFHQDQFRGLDFH